MTLVLTVGLSACQGRSVIDREAPFGSKVVRLGDVEVAAVDGTAIYLSDVEQLARAKGDLTSTQSIDPNTSLFKTTLRELIDQRVLGLAAITQSLDQSESSKRRQATALEQLYGRFVIEKALSEKVTDEAIMRLYEEQKALNDRGPERRARIIVVATQEEADDALQRLEDEEEFGVLAGILSIDEATRNKNGDLGYFSRNMLEDDIAKITFATPLKQVAPIFETDAGFHILEVVSERNVPQRPFEDMEAELREFLTYETINNMISDLRAESDIRLNVAAPLDTPQIVVKDITTGDEGVDLTDVPANPTTKDVKSEGVKVDQ
ncbi:MAG: peptidylprolyl isomerase [Maricaulaceae bacterium]